MCPWVEPLLVNSMRNLSFLKITLGHTLSNSDKVIYSKHFEATTAELIVPLQSRE